MKQPFKEISFVNQQQIELYFSINNNNNFIMFTNYYKLKEEKNTLLYLVMLKTKREVKFFIL